MPEHSAPMRPWLTIGQVPHPGPGGDEPPAPVVALDYAELTPQVVREIAPALVLSAVVDAGYDCLDVAQILQAAGFAGRYRAVVGKLPAPQMILREVAAHYPELDFDLLELDEADPAAAAIEPVKKSG